MNSRLLSLSIIALASLLQVSAKVHPLQGKSMRTPPATPDSVAYEAMLDNAPGSFASSGLPRLTFTGKDNSFIFGIGGFAKVTASFDAGSPISNPNAFVTADIPVPAEKGNGGLLQMSAMQSFIYANFVALPGTENQVGAFVGANFLNNYTPQLQYAYIKYRGLRAGLAYSFFADTNAAVPTIDYEGPCAMTTFPICMVNYVAKLDRAGHWQAGIAAQLPVASMTYTSAATKVNQRVPDIPVAVQYSWGGSNEVRFSAIMRNLYYRDAITSDNVDKVGWGIQFSGTSAICGGLRAYWQATYGKGLSSHFQDLAGEQLDLCPDPQRRGVLNTVKAWGGMAGLQYNFTDNVLACVAYSQVRTYVPRYEGGDMQWGDQYKYAQYAVGNVLWKINSLFSTGIEYIYGRRMNYSAEQAHVSRMQAMLKLTF